MGKAEIEERQREKCESLDLTQMSTFSMSSAMVKPRGLKDERGYDSGSAKVTFFPPLPSLAALGIMQKNSLTTVKKCLRSCIKHKVKPAYIKPHGGHAKHTYILAKILTFSAFQVTHLNILVPF